ncbi:MAG: sphinganine kinase lcb4 [Thelocarpon impressellum]|nr:MAG: sphinganine kinase lcb4 [Thelocarpon impressellum]
MDASSAIKDAHGDPFADTVGDAGLTLAVGRNASLMLGTDSLIVLDESFSGKKRGRGNCCGLLGDEAKATRAIAFFNVLWAELDDFELTVHYAQGTSKDVVRVAVVRYPVEKADRPEAAAWTLRLLDRAYGEAQRRRRVKVLVNPFSGRGGAAKWYSRDIEPIFRAARCELDVENTRHQGHAVEIAEGMNIDAYDVVACCSGDGLPHEVFNGLGKRKDARAALAKVAVVQLPCGSGNAMSWNLAGTDSPSVAALCVVKGLRAPLDLVSVTQEDRRTLSFLSQSVGIVAETDLGTDHLRWMGAYRFLFGFLVRLLGKTVYPADIAVKVAVPDKAAIRTHYRQEAETRRLPSAQGRPDPSSDDEASPGLPPLQHGQAADPLPSDWNLVPYDKLGNFYAGNMAYMSADANFFPASLPHDGCLDLVCIDGDISRLASIRAFVAVEKGTFFDLPLVSYRKITAYRFVPRPRPGGDGYISIDGERVPFGPFQAEVHRGLGTVLSKSGRLYEAQGV